MIILQCHTIFQNFALFWAQKMEYLKNYITYGGKILEGVYCWFYASKKLTFVKIGEIIKKLINPYKNLSEMW